LIPPYNSTTIMQFDKINFINDIARWHFFEWHC
jgi:hypothetical protein